jgi:hypothetical protein
MHETISDRKEEPSKRTSPANIFGLAGSSIGKRLIANLLASNGSRLVAKV